MTIKTISRRIKYLAAAAPLAAALCVTSADANAMVFRTSTGFNGPVITIGPAFYYSYQSSFDITKDSDTGAYTSSQASYHTHVGWGDSSVHLAEGQSSARGDVKWTKGASPGYTREAKGKIVLFGNTYVDTTGSNCGTGLRCATGSKTLTSNKSITVLAATFFGISVNFDLKASGSAGFSVNSKGTSLTSNSFASAAQLGPASDLSVGASVKGSLPLGLSSVTLSISVQVAKVSGGPVVSNALKHNSRTDVDHSWSNVNKNSISAGGGKITAKGCAAVLGCSTATLYSWDGIPVTSKTYWNEKGSLNNETAW